MTAKSFCEWLSAMGISGAQAAHLLGVNANTITRYRRSGAPKAVALACTALFHRLEEWK
jgi:predicted site-specific integrase-resolvase